MIERYSRKENDGRRRRLAEALRSNLKRRKTQQRERSQEQFTAAVDGGAEETPAPETKQPGGSD
jgi:hypothetical protein